MLRTRSKRNYYQSGAAAASVLRGVLRKVSARARVCCVSVRPFMTGELDAKPTWRHKLVYTNDRTHKTHGTYMRHVIGRTHARRNDDDDEHKSEIHFSDRIQHRAQMRARSLHAVAVVGLTRCRPPSFGRTRTATTTTRPSV